jgi:glycosyltransferase involved in cell wall biosynthesis
MSVLIFHPSVAPHVQQAARSLYEAGQLDRLITAVRDDPHSRLQSIVCSLASIAGGDLRSRFSRRAVTEVPLEKVESYPWGELLRVATASFDRDGRMTDFIWEWAETGFDRCVARRLHPELSGVYGFEYSSLAAFQRARELGVPVVYEVPAPEPRFVHQLLDAEMDKFPELRTAYHRYTAVREEQRIARRRAEWHCADLILVNSNFTKNSYARAGLDCSKVRVNALGAPTPIPRALALASPEPSAPLTLLWAGTFSIRKGAHYLLDAWRAGNFGRQARLLVFGAIGIPDRILRPLPDGIELRGSVPRAELMEHYRRADALVFPTLCDGFGMVATEAWSRGLPVITTDRAGVAEMLRPGLNGLLIRAADADAIAAALDWCLSHRSELRGMREAALATAAAWQWSDYRQALADAVVPVLKTSRSSDDAGSIA